MWTLSLTFNTEGWGGVRGRLDKGDQIRVRQRDGCLSVSPSVLTLTQTEGTAALPRLVHPEAQLMLTPAGAAV